MKENLVQIKEVCSFYVNSWHLTTMILPHIHQSLKEGNDIITLLENRIDNNVKEIVSKMNLKEEITKQITNINWTSTKIIKYSNIKTQIEKIANKQNNIEVLISGEKEYIKLANSNIKRAISQLKIEKEITIINCYDITKFSNINEITKEHQYILNTSGIKKIKEEFHKQDKKDA